MPRPAGNVAASRVITRLRSPSARPFVTPGFRRPNTSTEPDELAYYAAQATWFVVVTDVALFAAITAALGLLLRKRFAVALFTISLVAIAVTNSYELAAGTSRMLVNRPALVVTVIIAGIAAFELLYAAAMKRRGVLK